MQLQVRNPQIQTKLEEWSSQTGRPAEELVEDVIAGYFDELAQVRQTLDSRYDDIKSGKVELIDSEDTLVRLKAKSEAWRKSHE